MDTSPRLSTQRIDNVNRVLAVASGKGGVGKTTVAVNLALALHQNGVRVGLFDADLYGPNVPLMLGLRRRQSTGFRLPLARPDREPYLPAIDCFGLKVMSIGFLLGDTDTVVLDARAAARMLFQTLRDVIWGELDVLILDLPPGTGEPQQTLLRILHVDGALIVTTPQVLSRMDASRSLGMLQQLEIPVLGVIENMSYLHCPHCGEPVDILSPSSQAWAVDDTELPYLGRIPMHGTLSNSISAEHPLVQPHSDAPEAQVFRQIASAVMEKITVEQDERK
ncbi:MAG: hypothetical protein ETSY2_47495 [Candidatus Entotheonella gemina]|uniref:Iron-sulfur cluster carrier protein n=1 Tax=Candidatus Entotheonella gemina TaxID=1429439 RepID=W4LD64_9BACT|nr:MAG: hypothetical protein ETSY2_47495 [Candidatus Entotheonella gemina]